MTNWNAMQAGATVDKNTKKPVRGNAGVKPKYMAMGSWKADLSKGGAKRGGS